MSPRREDAGIRGSGRAGRIHGTGTVFLEARTLPPGGVEGFDAADVTYANLMFQTITSADQAPGC